MTELLSHLIGFGADTKTESSDEAAGREGAVRPGERCTP